MSEPLVITTLRSKRAELEREMHQAERRIIQLRADLSALEQTMRLFDPTLPPRRADIGRQVGFARAVLETIRNSETPLTVREIATTLASERGIDVSTPRRLQAVGSRVRKVLARARTGIVGKKDGDVIRWRVE